MEAADIEDTDGYIKEHKAYRKALSLKLGQESRVSDKDTDVPVVKSSYLVRIHHLLHWLFLSWKVSSNYLPIGVSPPTARSRPIWLVWIVRLLLYSYFDRIPSASSVYCGDFTTTSLDLPLIEVIIQFFVVNHNLISLLFPLLVFLVLLTLPYRSLFLALFLLLFN